MIFLPSQITFSETNDIWSPDALIWVTDQSPNNPWLPFFDYKLNFLISKFFRHQHFVVPQHLIDSYQTVITENNDWLINRSMGIAQEDSLPLIFINHGMLPCNMIVLLKQWEDIIHFQKWNVNVAQLVLRLFNFPNNINDIILKESKWPFVRLELVTLYAPDF